MFRSLFIAVLLVTGTSGEVRPSGRIIGGNNAVIESYPYQVSLVLGVSKLHLCGGSIISPEYILTAAHCVESMNSPKRVMVRSGSSWKSRGGSLHSVKELVMHEGFGMRDDMTPVHDLALLKLDKPIRFDSKRQPIEMFEHNCGGSIISAEFVLTAAHCLPKGVPLSYHEIRSGSSYRNEGGVLHPLAEIVYYDEHNASDALRHDIALVRVARPFEFDDSRRPIELFAAGEALEDGAPGVVTGWGYTEQGLPRQLQVVVVPTVSKRLCRQIYGGEMEGQFCAGYYGVGGKDACQSDSGGPLAVGGRLAGVVSYGTGCALPEYPGVYAEVAYYRDWIRRHSGV